MRRAAFAHSTRHFTAPSAHNKSSPTTTSALLSAQVDGARLRQTLSKMRSGPDLSAQDGLRPQRPNARSRSVSSHSISKVQDASASEQEVPSGRISNHDSVQGPHHGQLPQSNHRPNTEQEEEHVYVLTLKTTDSIALPMNDMRKRYFPKHLNKTPAHLTLFHALPHSQLSAMEADLGIVATCTKPFYISTGRPFRMRRGVGVCLGDGTKTFLAVREDLRTQWLGWLSEQDSGAWQPHWTVMNKVDEEKKVSQAFNTIRRDLFENIQGGWATGLDLWRYDRGDWEWTKEYSFIGNGKSAMGTPVQTPGSYQGEGYFDATPTNADAKDSGSNQASRGTETKGAGAWKRSGERVAGLFKSKSMLKMSLRKDNER